MIIQIKLLLKNCSFLVGGAVSLDNLGIILTGASASGKTTATLNFMNNFRANFISDDLMILCGNRLYGYPSVIPIRKYNLAFVSFNEFVNPLEKFKGRVLTSTKSNFDIYFLEKSSSRYIENISRSEGINKLCNVNNKILLYCHERILSLLPYIYEELSLLRMQEKQQELFSEHFRDSSFYILSAENTTDYVDILKRKYISNSVQPKGKESKLKKVSMFIRQKGYDHGRSKCNEIMKKWVVLKSVRSFLDTGCGDGTFTSEFARAINAENVYGVELSERKVVEAISRGIRCEKFDLNMPWPYESDFFDVILSNQVIEHLHNTRLYCEECYRCLKKNGQLVIASENLSSWINILSLSLGWMPFSMAASQAWVGVGNPLKFDAIDPKHKMTDKLRDEYRAAGIAGIAGHVRVLSIIGLLDCLRRAGFGDVKTITTGYLPFRGNLSDFLCSIDKSHGHFLVVTGFK